MALEQIDVKELKDRFEGDLSTRFTDAYLQVKIEDAIALVEGEYPIVASRLASGALSQQNFNRIIADVVFRVIRNPGGYVTEGEGGVSYGLRATVASGDLWLTDRDIRLLTGNAGGSALPGTVSIGIDAGWGA
jgi:hypothetical protein